MAAEIPVFRPLALAIVLGCAVVTIADSDAASSGLQDGCTQITVQIPLEMEIPEVAKPLRLRVEFLP